MPTTGQTPFKHEIETLFETFLYKCTRENIMVRSTTDGRTTYQGVQIINSFDIYYDTSTKKKTKRLYTVRFSSGVKNLLLHNYNLIEINDYVQLPDRYGYKLFYLQLAKMIVSVKYKLEQNKEPVFTSTVDELASIFDIKINEPRQRKRKVTQTLERINRSLSSTKFFYQYIKGENQSYAYTIAFTFPEETLNAFNGKLKALIISRLEQECITQYGYSQLSHIENRYERSQEYKRLQQTPEFKEDFLSWFLSPQDLDAKNSIYERILQDVFPTASKEEIERMKKSFVF
jgi:hypothetical protein